MELREEGRGEEGELRDVEGVHEEGVDFREGGEADVGDQQLLG